MPVLDKNLEIRKIINMTTEITKIKKALKKQRERRASFEDIEYLIQKENQYGTLNPVIIQNLIQ